MNIFKEVFTPYTAKDYSDLFSALPNPAPRSSPRLSALAEEAKGQTALNGDVDNCNQSAGCSSTSQSPNPGTTQHKAQSSSLEIGTGASGTNTSDPIVNIALSEDHGRR